MTDTVCEVDGCQRPTYAAKPICEPHYRRLLRTGSVSDDVPIGARRTPRRCSALDCLREATERGLCHAHYLRLVRTGQVRSERPLARSGQQACAVERCHEVTYARSMCRVHYRRFMKHGDAQADRPIRSPGREGHVHHGYRVVSVPKQERWLVDGRTSELEHRLVMARMLGRPLTTDESVHHRNGDRLCNRPDNLELWSRWQPRGQRVADKLQWAVELLERYTPEALADRQVLPGEELVPPSRFELPLPP
jgi:hypothetical protein